MGEGVGAGGSECPRQSTRTVELLLFSVVAAEEIREKTLEHSRWLLIVAAVTLMSCAVVGELVGRLAGCGGRNGGLFVTTGGSAMVVRGVLLFLVRSD